MKVCSICGIAYPSEIMEIRTQFGIGETCKCPECKDRGFNSIESRKGVALSVKEISSFANRAAS